MKGEKRHSDRKQLDSKAVAVVAMVAQLNEKNKTKTTNRKRRKERNGNQKRKKIWMYRQKPQQTTEIIKKSDEGMQEKTFSRFLNAFLDFSPSFHTTHH